MSSPQPDRGDPPPLPRPHHGQSSLQERFDHWRQEAGAVLSANTLVRLVLGALTLIAGGGLMFWLARPPGGGPPLEEALPMIGAVSVPTEAAPAPETVVVHVAGAVLRPGLVQVSAGSRVADVVSAAGGPSATADLDRVNLAGTVHDADRVYVPEVGKEPPVVVSDSALAEASEGPLDLNRATEEQLDELPGVGPATARAIVAHREDNGPFTSISALQEVPGIGPSKLAQLRELVTLGSR